MYSINILYVTITLYGGQRISNAPLRPGIFVNVITLGSSYISVRKNYFVCGTEVVVNTVHTV
jgi:hypothetical protein